jgi:hypothetical protein
MKAVYLVAALVIGFILTPKVSATPISATEIIEDLPPYDFIERDLKRTWFDSNGFSQTENNDATIVANNQVDNDFGFYNNGDVSYRHDLTWLTPAPGTYLVASLDISAFGPDLGDDQVATETINLGALTNDGLLILDNFTTTIFASFTPVQLSLLLTDGFLNVTVNKNAGGGLANLDLLSVYKSSLTVRYEPVPEPATALLLGSAGLFGALRLRRNA